MPRWFALVVGYIARIRAPAWAFAPILALAAWAAWPNPERASRERRVADEFFVRAEAAAAAAPVVTGADGMALMNFKALEIPLRAQANLPQNAEGEPAYAPLVPARVEKYNGSLIRIRGFMVPTKNERGQARAFMILPSQMTCCYGRSPSFCEFINARMQAAPAPIQMDRPLTFEGTLHVGDIYVNGYWSALYTLDCTNVHAGL